MTRRRATIVWSWIAAALVVLATAMLLRAINAPADVRFWISGGLVLAAILIVVVAAQRQWRPAYAWLYGGSLTAAAVWIPCAIYWGATQPFVGLTWLAGTIVTAMLAPVIPATMPADAAPVFERLSARATLMRRVLTDIGKVSVETIRVQSWSQGDGWTASGRFGDGGHHVGKLTSKLAEIESALNLPSTGVVEIEGGATKRDFRIHVSRGECLAEPIPYPASLIRSHSIYGTFVRGRYQDGQDITFDRARQDSEIVMGSNGAGKSGCMHTWIAGFVTCTDCLVWVIDLKGGSLGQPWIWPWQRGEAHRPAIDALATTAWQAEVLFRYAREIGLARLSRYRDLMRSHNTTDVPLSPEVPGIRIFVDEPKMLFEANGRLAQLAAEVQEVLRAAGIRPSYSMLGGTVTYLPSQIKAQIKHRTIMDVETRQDIAQLTGWPAAQKMSLPALRSAPGMTYTVAESGDPRLGRYFHTRPDTEVKRIAIAAADWRPELETWTRDLPWGDAYARRWDPDWGPVESERISLMSSSNGDRQKYPDELPRPKPAMSPTEALGAMAEMTERLRARNEGRPERDINREFDALVPKVKPARAEVIAYLSTTEGNRATTKDIVTHLQTNGFGDYAESTIKGWLAEMTTDGVIDKPRQGHYALP